ncbi:MAG: LolA family protein [Bacteroidota bacterium]|jgi:outer membrane lipoprotein carrier protein
MKNVILAISVCLTLSADTFAQATKDPKAQAILKEVSAKFKATKSLSASFKVTTLDQKTKKSDSRSGSIVLKGNKYKLMLAGQEIYCDGKSAWTYLKEANEVQISGADDKTNGISPTNIFTIYEKGFSSKYIGETKVDNVAVHHIELVPDDAKKPYFKIQVYINKTDKIITSAKIFEKNGTHITYSVEKIKLNVDAPDNVFAFDKSKYPGIEVVDLR